MIRYKSHLIAVKKHNHQEKMVMRDVRDAMQYLVIIMSHHQAATQQHASSKPSRQVTHRHNKRPATHHYRYDAKVTPFTSNLTNR